MSPQRTIKMKKRIKATVLYPLLLLGVFCGIVMQETVAFAEEGSTVKHSVNIGAASLDNLSTAWSDTDGMKLYFGADNSEQPVRYRVIPQSIATQTVAEDSVLLDADTILVNIPFHRSASIAGDNQASGHPNEWTGSDLQAYLMRRYGNSKNGAAGEWFTEVEAGAIAETSLIGSEQYYSVDGNMGTLRDYASTDYLFSLSAKEVETLYADRASRIKAGYNEWWWLRTATAEPAFSGYVFSTGMVVGGNVDTGYVGLSPALNLKLSSVLFTSAVAGETCFDKSSEPVSGAVSTIDSKEWKVTLNDAGKAIKITDGKCILPAADGTVTVPYTYTDNNGQNPTNQVSVIIMDKDYGTDNAKILYYGALQNIKNETGDSCGVQDAKVGTGTFTLPDSLPEEYRIYILAESVSASKYSDYASEPSDVRHTHCVCGTGDNTGSHAEHTEITYQALPDGFAGGMLNAGNYCLADDLHLSESITIRGDVSLCLNGHKITGKSDNTVFKVDAGNQLHLSDCMETGALESNTYELEVGGMVHVYRGRINPAGDVDAIYMTGGTLNQYGGTIYGGVMGQDGRYEMSGGEIEGSPAFRMSGGEIYLSGSPKLTAPEGAAHILLNDNRLNIHGQGATGTVYGGDGVLVECGLEAGSVVVYDITEATKGRFGTANHIELYLKDSNLVAHQNHIGGKADCINLAVCSVCNEFYGKVDPFSHTNLVKVEAKAATKQSAGNIRYWKCTGCKKYFSDAAGTKEITNLEQINTRIIPNTGDQTPIGLWSVVFALSAIVSIIIWIMKDISLKKGGG